MTTEIAPSLGLLTGKAEVPPAVVEVDFATATQDEIDNFITGFGLTVPDHFLKFSLEEKRAWLTEQVVSEDQPEAMAEAEVITEPEVDQPKKKKGKAAKKTKNEVMVAPLQGEIVTNDELVGLVHEIENLPENEALDKVAKLLEHTDETWFKLGGILSIISTKGWYKGYKTFNEYVEHEHGLKPRRAHYWIAIYNSLIESKVPWDKVKGLGWTKLRVIAPILTLANVDTWVEFANTHSITEVEAKVDELNAPAITDQTEKVNTVNKTFKLFEGQKANLDAALEKVKESSPTVSDSVALENICLEYLGSQSLTQRLKDAGLDGALKALSQAFPGEVQLN